MISGPVIDAFSGWISSIKGVGDAMSKIKEFRIEALGSKEASDSFVKASKCSGRTTYKY